MLHETPFLHCMCFPITTQRKQTKHRGMQMMVLSSQKKIRVLYLVYFKNISYLRGNIVYVFTIFLIVTVIFKKNKVNSTHLAVDIVAHGGKNFNYPIFFNVTGLP